MLNRLPDLEEEDVRFGLHVGAEVITDYNINIVYNERIPQELMIPRVPLQDAKTVNDNLKKLGIFIR